MNLSTSLEFMTYSDINESSNPIEMLPAIGMEGIVSRARHHTGLLGTLYSHVLTLIPAWMSTYINYNVWDEIAYPFQNFNGATMMWFTIMCSITKFELNQITSLFANAQKLLDKSDKSAEHEQKITRHRE